MELTRFSSQDDKTEEKKKKKKTEGDMRAFADQYDKNKWVTVASKHFDLTGQRITAARAKEVAEGK